MTQAHTRKIDAAIIQGLEQEGPCTMEDLLRRHTSYSWSQVFCAVDRLSRQGYLRLHYHGRCRYTVSAVPGELRARSLEPLGISTADSSGAVESSDPAACGASS